MSTEALIPDFAPLFYGEAQTGKTVRGGHTITRAASANVIALGRPAKRIGPVQSQKTDGSTYTVGYVRSHTSIKQLWLAWYFHADGTNTPASISMSLTITDAAGHTVGPSSALIPVGFKGTSTDAIRATYLYQSDIFLGAAGYLDLDALAATLTDTSWSLEFTYSASTVYVPLDRVIGWECPRSQVDSADTYGALTGPVNPGNPILAGSTTTSGYERLAKTVEGAVLCNRDLLCVSWQRQVGYVPSTASAALAAMALMTEGGGVPYSWRVRPRVVYVPSSSTGEPHRVRYLYQVTGGGTATIRCTATSIGAGSVISVDAAGLTSAAFAWSAWSTLTIPTDGTDGIVAVTFTAKTTAGTVYLASIQLEENQT